LNRDSEFILSCQEKIFENQHISEADAEKLLNIPKSDLKTLSDSANMITRKFQGNEVDVEQLSNIKKNYCSEDCSFCGQSSFFNTNVEDYQLLPKEEVVKQAKKAFDEGAQSYCLVAAWRGEIKNQVEISIECSLGFLTKEQANQLKKLGVKRYNHNLETARSKFPEICTTHSYQDRLDTLKIARDAGLELCTGGIIGMGETREQRLELILELARISPEEVTLNLLVPVPGTPMELQTALPVDEILRTFAVIRFLLPKSIIKISGNFDLAVSKLWLYLFTPNFFS